MLKIITDSSSNITQEEAEKWGITVLPLTINFGSEEFRDGIDIGTEAFYEKLVESEELPHTSQLTETQVEEAVSAALETHDEVLIITIASALSGSYERCAAVAKNYSGVVVYDSKCTTVMQKMLVAEALKNREKSAAEVVKILEELRPKVKLFAALDTLEYLGKGGRLSKTSALLGSLLKIKPVITVTAEGKVELISKQFGINKSISYIASKVDVSKIDYTRPVYLIYTMDSANSSALIEKIGAQYSEKDNICPVIGTHIGPKAAGFVYAEK